MCVDAGGRDGGNGTWDGGGLRGCPEGEDARLRLALLILCHDVNLVLRIPVQAAQHHVLAAVGEADLGFPLRPVLLRKECGGGQNSRLGNRVRMWSFFTGTKERGHFRDFHRDPVLKIGLLADGMHSSLNNFPKFTSKEFVGPKEFVVIFWYKNDLTIFQQSRNVASGVNFNFSGIKEQCQHAGESISSFLSKR